MRYFKRSSKFFSSPPRQTKNVLPLVGLSAVVCPVITPESLADSGIEWTDATGNSSPLTRDHILIVAPYNAQVGALTARLPGARVGTVDKFQGQEAPVVIYSMTTSSPDDAPRGMSFLYDLNRLNVATSRARCACILVADPSLFEPDCRTPDQMRWANGLCRFRELATVTRLSTSP